jgi:hypothetical protein
MYTKHSDEKLGVPAFRSSLLLIDLDERYNGHRSSACAPTCLRVGDNYRWASATTTRLVWGARFRCWLLLQWQYLLL